MNTYNMELPLTKEDVKKLKIGDIVYLTGDVYTSRDAAHKRFKACIEKGEELPIDLKDKTIFYAGPCPTKPGRTMGSIAPTTSARMDQYVEMTLKLGVTAMIGKGDRADYVADLCKKYGGVYLLSIGGASAMISNQVKSCDVIAYEDLGTESIKKLYVENLRVIVGIDTNGDVFQKREIEKYREV
ncbi:TRZ/ATZ family protein [Peptoniphilus sp. AGMB00490]|uniref:TRZ/ATZ family protein n=2 Tax=Peptoniphilus TaxID=162289 RepID=A0ACD6AZQ1_9FIRM|nr:MULTISPECIES: FumA C-terminus/TtdB family hydratase beta subunit [Peptoniphilus]NMW85302.1 TRZ/ATZ family protein [Peptoniphilus faecalis]OLR65279.1 fumarate hydratase [Peptoniphilus porci]